MDDINEYVVDNTTESGAFIEFNQIANIDIDSYQNK